MLVKNAGGDTITDFTHGIDQIGLSAGGLSFGQLSIHASGGGTLIQYGGETLTMLTGVNPGLTSAADFALI